MKNKCYFFITITILTVSAMYYKINCLSKKVLYNNELLCSLIQKLQDVNELNMSCVHLGSSLDELNMPGT